jgi:hypothetical protein
MMNAPSMAEAFCIAIDSMNRMLKALQNIEHKTELIKCRFIPIKVPINRTYNPKHHKLTIRNNLPQRMRINEKAES